MSGFEGMRCSDPVVMNYFTSDNPHERRAAQRLCGTCPAITACQRYAETVGEKYGIWHGVSYYNNKPTMEGRCARCFDPLGDGQRRFCGRVCADLVRDERKAAARGAAA